MRRIVTGNEKGRSRVLIDEELDGRTWTNIWAFSLDEPLGHDPAASTEDFPKTGPDQGSWQVVTVPPEAEMLAALAKGVPGIDAKGFHLTPTLDFVVVLDGAVTLALDDGDVIAQPGDLVVQRNTNHAWLNRNDHPIRLLCLILGLPA